MTNKLPKYFVLQKAGSESSLDFERTVENKEIQRKNNPKGIFLWGVGNSTKKETIEKLLENEPEPYVIFSTITSKFRKQDIEHIDSERKTLRIWNSPELPEGAQVVTYAEKGGKGKNLPLCTGVPV